MFYVRVYKNGWSYRVNIEDDKNLQRVMDLCNQHFGDPDKVFDIPRVLPQPKVKKRK